MAVTSNTYTGDGILDTFAFTFPYIDETDVSVTIDGVSQTNPTNYSFATASSILFVTPPGNGTEVKIFRDTNIDTKKASFATGAALRASDLNLNFDQVLYVGQELENGLIEAFLPDDAVQTSMIVDGAVTSAKIADGTIVDADVNASAAIQTSKLAAGALDTSITISSDNIVNGTIATADIANGAIDNSKLGANAVTTDKILDGTIVDADISGSAEIAVSKLADGSARQLLQTDAVGTGVEWTSNVDVPGTLDVTGAATFDSTVSIPDGSAAAPTLRFTSDTDTGLYSSGADSMSIAAGGTQRVVITDSLFNVKTSSTFGSIVRITDGSAAGPAIRFSSDLDTGIYSGGADTIGISTGGTERLSIDTADATFSTDVVVNTTGAITVPDGTTAQRPGTPATGMIRYNSTDLTFEGYDGSTWGTIGGGASGAPGNPVFYENDTNVTADYTITSGKNAMSAGPITIDSGVTVTVPAGSDWTIV